MNSEIWEIPSPSLAHNPCIGNISNFGVGALSLLSLARPEYVILVVFDDSGRDLWSSSHCDRGSLI